MKKIILLSVVIMLLLTACEQLTDDMVNNVVSDAAELSDTVKKKHEFNGIMQNEVTNDTSETLSSTFLNLNSVLGREYKSGIINGDILQIILLSNGNPAEEFELFYNNDQETAINLCEAFDIDKINLKLVDDEENHIFEIAYTKDDKSVSVSEYYADVITIK